MYDKRFAGIFIDIEEGLPVQMDFARITGEDGRISQLAAGAQLHDRTVRQIDRLHILYTRSNDIDRSFFLILFCKIESHTSYRQQQEYGSCYTIYFII